MSNYYEQNSAPRPDTATANGQNINSTPTTAAPETRAAADTHAQTQSPPYAHAPHTAQNAGNTNAQSTANTAQKPNGQGTGAYSTPGGNLGQQLGGSIHNWLSKGDWSELTNVGNAMGNTAKEVGQEIKASVQQYTSQYSSGGKKAGESGTPQSYKYKYEYKYDYNKPAKKQGGQMQTPPWYGKSVASPQQKPTNFGGVGQIITGGIGIGFFGMVGISMITAMGAVGPAIFFGILALGSGGLLGMGIRKHDTTRRLLAYQSKLMETNVLSFRQLAKATGYPEAQIRKDFKKGMRKGTLKYVYLDKEGDTVMLGDNTYNLYLQAEELHAKKLQEEAERALLMEENPELAQLEAFRAESAAMLEKIRKANEAIPGEEISRKLATMEETCAKIFSFVETHPAKLPDTRKFMNYYLPTTLKVVDKYREYEEMEFNTPSILKTREEIDAGLDTINEAFSNLLDELYKDETMDVSTDIEVLHTMLQQEGLTGKKFAIEADPGMTPR